MLSLRPHTTLAPSLPARFRPLRAQQSARIQRPSERHSSTTVQQALHDGADSSVKSSEKSKIRAPAWQSSDALQRAKELGSAIMSNPERVPDEKEVMEAMKACERAARQLMSYEISADDTDPASALLLLSKGAPQHPTSAAIGTDLLSSLAHQILLYPTIFITSDVLHSYVVTQSILRRPESFPGVFHLYATKPRPRANTKPLQFKTPNPRAHTAAIPADTANLALTAAIRAKDMDLACNIINTTFRQLAWHRYKILTRASLPLLGISLVPVGIWTLASKLSIMPTAQDPTIEWYGLFGGFMTYFLVVSSMGYIAMTTANDQMRRVTWADGTHLYDRWLREDERLAMDRVVLSFGFQDDNKWGDETGAKWQRLRDYIGARGFIVDRVSLMKGME